MKHWRFSKNTYTFKVLLAWFLARPQPQSMPIIISIITNPKVTIQAENIILETIEKVYEIFFACLWHSFISLHENLPYCLQNKFQSLTLPNMSVHLANSYLCTLSRLDSSCLAIVWRPDVRWRTMSLRTLAETCTASLRFSMSRRMSEKMKVDERYFT